MRRSARVSCGESGKGAQHGRHGSHACQRRRPCSTACWRQTHWRRPTRHTRAARAAARRSVWHSVGEAPASLCLFTGADVSFSSNPIWIDRSLRGSFGIVSQKTIPTPDVSGFWSCCQQRVLKQCVFFRATLMKTFQSPNE